jgi:hypothetical protein
MDQAAEAGWFPIQPLWERRQGKGIRCHKSGYSALYSHYETDIA